MKVLGAVNNGVTGVVFDIDNTVYPRSAAYFDEGSRRELEGCARAIDIPFEELKRRFEEKRAEIASTQGRKVAVTETVYALGVTKDQWSALRCDAWQPELWISPDSEISDCLTELAARFTVAFSTNSPLGIGRRVLKVIGIEAVVCPLKVLGPEVLGASKPDPEFFRQIASQLGLLPGECISIGDREFSDGPPALEAGYAGAIVVPGSRDETLQVVRQLLAGNFTDVVQGGTGS